MRINAGSICMTLIWNVFFSWTVWEMKRRKKYETKEEIQIMLLFYILGLIRVLFPFDFRPSIAIQLRGKFSKINEILCIKKYNLLGIKVTIAGCMIGVWGVVAALLMSNLGVKYQKFQKILTKYSVLQNGIYDSMIDKIKREKNIKKKIKVYCNKEIAIPCAMGIFEWKIFLPAYEYSEEELYYVLLHECTHFVNGDLYIKWFTEICCSVCWWNPLIHKMQSKMEKYLEIRCDLTVVDNMERTEEAEYLGTIVKTLKEAQKRQNQNIQYGIQLAKQQDSELKERFEITYKNRKNRYGRRKKLQYVILSGFFLILSYVFIPLPAYDPPVEEIVTSEEVIELTPENSYVEKEGDKYYWIYENQKDEIDETDKEELQQQGFEVREK